MLTSNIDADHFLNAEFVPKREEDRTVWYLDLLETQLKLTRDMVEDLKDYQQSLKESSD